jgi:hypothetical protein
MIAIKLLQKTPLKRHLKTTTNSIQSHTIEVANQTVIKRQSIPEAIGKANKKPLN